MAAELHQANRPSETGNQHPFSNHPLIKALEANQDGKLSDSEIQNTSAALTKLDNNQDGRLLSIETGQNPTVQIPAENQAIPGRSGTRPANSAGVRANRLALDADGDGIFTSNEIPARMQRIISRTDSNQNDAVDRDELERFLQQIGPGRNNELQQAANPSRRSSSQLKLLFEFRSGGNRINGEKTFSWQCCAAPSRICKHARIENGNSLFMIGSR